MNNSRRSYLTQETLDLVAMCHTVTIQFFSATNETRLKLGALLLRFWDAR